MAKEEAVRHATIPPGSQEAHKRQKRKQRGEQRAHQDDGELGSIGSWCAFHQGG